MNTIIEKIRAEIERLIVKHELEYTTAGYVMNELLSRLSTLEKEEKPSEGLEEEIQNQIHNHFFDLHGIAIAGTTAYATVEDMVYIARHFAKWQKEHDAELIEIAYNDGITIGMTKQKEQMMRDGNVILSEEDFDAEKEKSIELGYNLCKEQMMKEAVEWDYTLEDGRIEFEGDPLPCLNPILNLPYPKFKPGQKVKLIIVKED